MLSDWRASGILHAVEMYTAKLLTLDPFKDLEPLPPNAVVAQSTAETFPETGHADVNTRNIDSESEFVCTA